MKLRQVHCETIDWPELSAVCRGGISRGTLPMRNVKGHQALPECPCCGDLMNISRLASYPCGSLRRTFECIRCDVSVRVPQTADEAVTTAGLH
jgi:hypothetical protein